MANLDTQKAKKYWSTLSEYKHSVCLLYVSVFIVVLIIDDIIYYEEILANQFFNRTLFICYFFAVLPFIGNIFSYYSKNLFIVDIFFVVTSIFFAVGWSGALSVESFSNIVRLFVCFYGISYFARYMGSVVSSWWVLLIGVGLLEVWLLFRFPTLFQGGRLTFVGNANVSARTLLAAFVLLMFVVVNRKLFGAMVRRVALIQAVIAGMFIFATGSRQGIILGVLTVLGLERVFREKIDVVQLLRRSVQAAGVVLLGLGFVYGVVELVGADVYSRFFRFSLEENMRRVATYAVYGTYLIQNLGSLLFSGVENISGLFGTKSVDYIAGIKIGAPHNFILTVGLRRGVLALFSYLLFHFFIFRSMVRVHNWTGGRRTSALAIAIAVSVVLTGFVSNFLNQVSTPYAYLFYIIGGIYCNAERDLRVADHE